MKSKIAILFAGLALLTAVPANAENAFWQQSIEHTPVTQTTDLEVQEVRFRRGGFRRGGFRRRGFRRGFRRRGFLRRGFRRGLNRGRFGRGFKRGGFKTNVIRSPFDHGLGHKKFKSNFKFRRGGFHHDEVFRHNDDHFERFPHLDREHRFSEDQDFKSPETLNKSLKRSSLLIEQNDTQSLNEANKTGPVRSVEIIGGQSGDSSLFTEGIQEESPEELLGVELNLVPELENE